MSVPIGQTDAKEILSLQDKKGKGDNERKEAKTNLEK